MNLKLSEKKNRDNDLKQLYCWQVAVITVQQTGENKYNSSIKKYILNCRSEQDNHRNMFATYKSMLVRYIIGELEFMKGNGLAHPLTPFGWAVRVDVHALWHL